MQKEYVFYLKYHVADHDETMEKFSDFFTKSKRYSCLDSHFGFDFFRDNTIYFFVLDSSNVSLDIIKEAYYIDKHLKKYLENVTIGCLDKDNFIVETFDLQRREYKKYTKETFLEIAARDFEGRIMDDTTSEIYEYLEDTMMEYLIEMLNDFGIT